MSRPLTEEERSLAKWMLENGASEGKAFLVQLANARATSWKCSCGCASYKFKVEGMPEAPPGTHILGDFFFGSDAELSGAFIFESEGILSGVEIYGLSGAAPSVLPLPSQLRPVNA
ncbi:hypothetical protein ACFONG_19350 [Uliginosibacterium paludis]|uniref:Uncharacterized protein n=1 Tax=Uliginosibacterium paludis TaxID=1615952 RepID=A0ABV2CUA6_9RHOO